MARDYVLSYKDEYGEEHQLFAVSSMITAARKTALRYVKMGYTVHFQYAVHYGRKFFDFDYEYAGGMKLYRGYPCWYANDGSIKTVKSDGSLGKAVSVWDKKLGKFVNRM